MPAIQPLPFSTILPDITSRPLLLNITSLSLNRLFFCFSSTKVNDIYSTGFFNACFFIRRVKKSERIFVHKNLLSSLGLGNLVYILDVTLFSSRKDHIVSTVVLKSTDGIDLRNTNTDLALAKTHTDLALPKPKTYFLECSFQYSGATLWNNLKKRG